MNGKTQEIKFQLQRDVIRKEPMSRDANIAWSIKKCESNMFFAARTFERQMSIFRGCRGQEFYDSGNGVGRAYTILNGWCVRLEA